MCIIPHLGIKKPVAGKVQPGVMIMLCNVLEPYDYTIRDIYGINAKLY